MTKFNIPNWLKILWFFPSVLLRAADYNPLMYFWKLFFNPPSLKYPFKLGWLDYCIYIICLGLFIFEYQYFARSFVYSFATLPTTFGLLVGRAGCLYMFGMPVFVLIISIFVYPIIALWRLSKSIFSKVK